MGNIICLFVLALSTCFCSSITKEYNGALYYTLKVVDYLLDKHQITYWANGGALIGYHRHGSSIPWDHDVDCEYFCEDEEKLLSLEEEFNAFGLAVYHLNNSFTLFCLRDYLKNHPLSAMVELYPAYVDQDKIRLVITKVAGLYPNSYWEIEELRNLHKVNFGPVKLSISEDYINYICRYYGKEALTQPPKDRVNVNPYEGSTYLWPTINEVVGARDDVRFYFPEGADEPIEIKR